MRAYYNEIDKFAAQWLRNLIAAGHLPEGDVDERSIKDVSASDLDGYDQCHFFAGIGGWPYALKLAGWNGPVWTGSCPCQPFSVASVAHGGAQGQSDRRHLWPHFYRLIGERKPSVVFGEQVASAIGWGWWDGAAVDLEGAAYACGAAVLRADAFGAAHQRKRLYWVAYADRAGREGYQSVHGVPIGSPAPLSVDGDSLARARRALDGGYRDLLPRDGLSVGVERARTSGYGNAIVPQVGAAFVTAFMQAAA